MDSLEAEMEALYLERVCDAISLEEASDVFHFFERTTILLKEIMDRASDSATDRMRQLVRLSEIRMSIYSDCA